MADVQTTPDVLARFNVNTVEASPKRGGVYKQDNLLTSWSGTFNAKVEACSAIPDNTIMLFNEQNLLARAVHKAFYDHHPLRLSPDAIWITIAQGFANHVNQNAEALRSKFVDFQEGKKKITISRPSFVKGSPTNDWVGVFPEFAEKIQEYIGEKTVNLIQSDFSTTTVLEKTVSQIVLMDTVKSYFEYTMVCGCGIPFIELTGTVADWEKIRAKAESLRQYDLGWWIDVLGPILDEFVAAAKGKANVEFFTSICNLFAGSGFREPVSGWIQAFYPYLLAAKERGGYGRKADFTKMQRNTYMEEYKKSIQNKAQTDFETGLMRGGDGCGRGIGLDSLPSGISKVPFKYVDVSSGITYDMHFCGGVTALVQDQKEGTLIPVVGWAVIE